MSEILCQGMSRESVVTDLCVKAADLRLPDIRENDLVVIAMPVASFGTMFCMKYGRNPALMTEMTFITTVGSIFTIPLITMLFC